MAILQITFLEGAFGPNNKIIPNAGVFNTFHRMSNKVPVTKQCHQFTFTLCCTLCEAFESLESLDRRCVQTHSSG